MATTTQRYDYPLPSRPDEDAIPGSRQYTADPNERQNQLSSYQSARQGGPQRSQRPQLSHVQSQPQQEPQPLKTRRGSRTRTFSFRSDKSEKTQRNGHFGGIHSVKSHELRETSAEKESKRLHTKADPRMAISEAEPSAVAQIAANFTEHAPLRSIQHLDLEGKPITDPDRSNPTRSRMERPLDTIRGFEAAIDGGQNRRSIFMGSSSESTLGISRRNSAYGNGNGNGVGNQARNGPRFPQDSYYGYGGQRDSVYRSNGPMHDSRFSVMTGGRDAYMDGYNYDNGYGPSTGNGRIRHSRMNTEPRLGYRSDSERNLYPVPNNHRSYETVASAAADSGGSGGSASLAEPQGYVTDPTSSENSSIDRRSPPKRQGPVNDYGIALSQTKPLPPYQPPNSALPASQPRTMPTSVPKSLSSAPPNPTTNPAAPPRGTSLLRKASLVSKASRPEMGEKRKSWLSRRFTKNSS